jgi:3-oxoacyl-[acyl-carrier protein] reductase
MEVMDGQRVLVGGGTGNVGRHLVRALLEAGAEVVVPSRSRARLEELATTLEGDLRGRLVPVLGDLTADSGSRDLLARTLPLDGAVASLGGFVPAPSTLDAPREDLDRALSGYLHAHRDMARAVIPHVTERGGGYVMINGPLAYEARFPGTGLVSIATAAQAMMARILAHELAETPLRLNEVVIYSSFGRGHDDRNVVSGADIGAHVAWLLSPSGAAVRGRSLHLRQPEDVGVAT